jgi:hypothetical protein
MTPLWQQPSFWLSQMAGDAAKPPQLLYAHVAELLDYLN